MKSHNHTCCKLNSEIEVVPYGGKDTLKNTVLVQFVIRKFDQVFVTFDLDVEKEIKPALHRLGLSERFDYIPLGISKPGKDCIEGLLPQRVISAVVGREPDLIMKLSSSDTSDRTSAKNELKKLYLTEFLSIENYTKDELSEFDKAIKVINSRLSK